MITYGKVKIVVPYVGTWIEMYQTSWILRLVQVVPYVGTWIEIDVMVKRISDMIVVPYVGTWIEIPSSSFSSLVGSVVPYVGTWIEIFTGETRHICDGRRSLRGNVDRNAQVIRIPARPCPSFPTWERG